MSERIDGSPDTNEGTPLPSDGPLCDDDVCALPGAAADGPAIARIEPDLAISSDDPEAFLEFAEARGWGDGLPLLPPTPERVERALACLPPSIDPDEVLTALPPRGGLVTRRTLAVNAVMAGCPAGTLPVLTTAIRALTRAEVNLRGVNATTHPVAPLLIVHGAVATEQDFNGGLGAFGPGNRANASVGRALRLVMLNVAGARSGAGDASTQGQPSKYTYCVAENQSESPWAPYPESRGLDAPSAVTVHCGENPHNVQDHEVRSAERTLEMIASTMTTLGSNNAPVSSAEWFVFLGPEHARHLADAGYSREEVQRFLFENARLPMARFRRAFEIAQYADWEEALGDDDEKPIARDPDRFRILVTGGAGKHSCVVPSWGMTASVTLPLLP